MDSAPGYFQYVLRAACLIGEVDTAVGTRNIYIHQLDFRAGNNSILSYTKPFVVDSRVFDIYFIIGTMYKYPSTFSIYLRIF